MKREYVGNFCQLNTQYLPETPWCFGEILIYRYELKFLFYYIHFVDEAFAVTEFVDNEQYVADIDVDTTL